MTISACFSRARPLRAALATLAGALCAAGCTSLAPHYGRPAAPVPDTLPVAAGEADAQGRSAADVPWQDFFRDERLRHVIQSALDNSRSLRQTLADVAAARATYRVQRAALLPTVDAGVDASKARSFSSSGGQTSNEVSQSVSATAGTSAWELDLFGKTRSLTEAELETYLGTAEAARATRLTLIAETATAWFTFASDRSQLELSSQTMQSAQHSLTVTRGRFENGVASRVDVREAETVYQQARADVASYSATVAQDRNALDALVGRPVEDAWLPTGLEQDVDTWLARVPVGLPSAVLLERPDVLEAEHQLKSANANIGAARAAFFPSITLTAAGGIASAALSGLFSGGASTIWSIAPSVSLPIFDGGANRASLDYAKAERDAYLAAYEAAIQTAFKEAANALASEAHIGEQLAAQRDLVTAAADSYRLADARYRAGVDSYLEAMTTQRTYYESEQTLVTTRLAALTSRVTLYKVLGGGVE